MMYIPMEKVMDKLTADEAYDLMMYKGLDITRCQDCKFYRAPSWCSHFNRIMNNTAYCSDGEHAKEKKKK